MNEVCDICSLEVKDERYKIQTKDKTWRFCCEGCEGIWRMLNEDEIKGEDK